MSYKFDCATIDATDKQFYFHVGNPKKSRYGRRCKCGTVLSIYNNKKTCAICRKKAIMIEAS